jgi:hypothetical protein
LTAEGVSGPETETCLTYSATEVLSKHVTLKVVRIGRMYLKMKGHSLDFAS